MRKLITFLFITISICAWSQKPLEIIHSKDDMTDKESWFVNRHLLVEDKEQLKGFGITFYLDKNKSGVLNFDAISAKLVGFKCIDNVEFIFMFENDEKITKSSFVKFNCDGTAMTWLTPSDLEKFSTLKVKKIRATNGRDGSQATADISEQDYFIKLINLLKEGKFTEKK